MIRICCREFQSFSVIQLIQLSELAKLSTHKSRNLLSDVEDYCNKINAVFYIHIFLNKQLNFLVRPLFA